MKDEELIELVYELNGFLSESLMAAGGGFSLYSNGYTSVILFGEFVMYDGDNDERPFDEDANDYAMTVKEWVISEYNKLTKMMTEVNFTGEQDD
jgi:hypothetical protein